MNMSSTNMAPTAISNTNSATTIANTVSSSSSINNTDAGNRQTNANNQASSTIVGTTCMELALEGERLCQAGDLKTGVKFFEEAVKVGTTEERTLSAIYSQLGNAYFYLEDYQKALDYHKQDVTLVHSIGDEAAEAKACGNLGNTYKMLGKFDEAAVYCRRYLEISRKLQDEVGEGRALYNLGNVYHMQGKRMIGTSEQESGELPNDIRSSLQRAIEYYEANLKVVTKLNDHVAMGRAYGNLGNTHYLLGNFESAVECHKKRLESAKQTSDKSAERRAHLNLGNANVFLGNFSEAIENYSSTLKLAQELNDKHTEAHSCYSLANTYTFLRDYKSAISFHLKYLELIRELDDKLGEGRACWSLVNIYQMVSDPESALIYAKKHYEIAELLGDETGLTSAKANIEELEETISQKRAVQLACEKSSSSKTQFQESASSADTAILKHNTDAFVRLSPDKRQEQEQRRFKKQLNSNLASDIDGLVARRRVKGERGVSKSSSHERLFDMIAHFQSGRIDDQRCEISCSRQPILGDNNPNLTSSTRAVVDNKENISDNNNSDNIQQNLVRSNQSSITKPMNAVSAAASAIKATYRKASLVAYPTQSQTPSIHTQRRPTVSAEHRDELFDLIAGAQGQRMDEQRASLPSFTLINGILRNPTNAGLLSRGQTIDQSSSVAKFQIDRPETIQESDQMKIKGRSQSIVPTATTAPINNSLNIAQQSAITRPKAHKLTRHFQTVDSDAQVHDEKFLDSLMRYQSTRFNDQRSEFPNRNRDIEQRNKDKAGQGDNFLDLIVKFQSDRINDQRSAPPAKNKNI